MPKPKALRQMVDLQNTDKLRYFCDNRVQFKKLTSVFHGSASPVINHEFRQNIVKVVVDPRKCPLLKISPNDLTQLRKPNKKWRER